MIAIIIMMSIIKNGSLFFSYSSFLLFVERMNGSEIDGRADLRERKKGSWYQREGGKDYLVKRHIGNGTWISFFYYVSAREVFRGYLSSEGEELFESLRTEEIGPGEGVMKITDREPCIWTTKQIFVNTRIEAIHKR